MIRLPQRQPGASRSAGSMPGAPTGRDRWLAVPAAARPTATAPVPSAPDEPAAPAARGRGPGRGRDSGRGRRAGHREAAQREAGQRVRAGLASTQPSAPPRSPSRPRSDVRFRRGSTGLAVPSNGSAETATDSWMVEAAANATPAPAAGPGHGLRPPRLAQPDARDDRGRDADLAQPAVELVQRRGRRRRHLDHLGDRGRLGGRGAGRRGARRSSSASPDCRSGVPASGWSPAASRRRPPPWQLATPRRSAHGLAAHAAGVSRGRTAAVDEPDHAPSTEEGPA